MDDTLKNFCLIYRTGMSGWLNPIKNPWEILWHYTDQSYERVQDFELATMTKDKILLGAIMKKRVWINLSLKIFSFTIKKEAVMKVLFEIEKSIDPKFSCYGMIMPMLKQIQERSNVFTNRMVFPTFSDHTLQ